MNNMPMQTSDKIYVAGHNGMVGSAIMRKLKLEGYSNLIYRSSKELDLRNQQAVSEFFEAAKPDFVFLAAAKVGGILANQKYKASFLYDNLMIQTNIIHQAHLHGVQKLLFLGSSCIYPKMAPQPIKESYLMTGPLESTNDAYAMAKITGIKMCQSYHEQYGSNFISVMPTNLYGPNDNYDLASSHVLPALIRKFHEAKEREDPSVTLWGTGTPKREFLHADDLADACYYLMQHYDGHAALNVGTGEDIAILELAQMIKSIVGYEGQIEHDLSKPDGTPRKLLDVSRLTDLGWKYSTPLQDGIRRVYEAYKNSHRPITQGS
jgi:GDP-L-fucose synthase